MALPGGTVATFHFNAQIIGRSASRSAVSAAAYRAGEKLHDERTGRTYDFSAKADVIHREVLLPEGAPYRLSDRATLWNEIERREGRKDSQLAREVRISLPRELKPHEAIDLARSYFRENFANRGMVVDLAIHSSRAADGGEQPHAHALLSMRTVDADGFGKKETAWNNRTLLGEWRRTWATEANVRLAELGHVARIDERSHAERGIVDRAPQPFMRLSARVEWVERTNAERAGMVPMQEVLAGLHHVPADPRHPGCAAD